MKKTIIATLTAALLTSALVAPARANDMGNLGIGLGIAILGKMMQGAGNGSSHHSRDREPGRGDKLVGRSNGNSSSDKGNTRSSPAVDPAIVLPDVGPEIAFRPSDDEVAAILAAANAPAPISDLPAAPSGTTVMLTDENGIQWGNVAPEVADKIKQAEALGMTKSQAFAALSGIKQPQQSQQMQTASDAALADVNSTPPVAIANQQAMQAMPTVMPPLSHGVTDTFADGTDGSELVEQADTPVSGQAATVVAPVASVSPVVAPVAVVAPVKVVQVDDRHGAYGTTWNRARTMGTIRDEKGNVWGGDQPADIIAKIDAMTASGMPRSEAIAANTDMAAPGKTKEQAAKEAADLAAMNKFKADQEARVAAAVQHDKDVAAQRKQEADLAAANKAKRDQVDFQLDHARHTASVERDGGNLHVTPLDYLPVGSEAYAIEKKEEDDQKAALTKVQSDMVNATAFSGFPAMVQTAPKAEPAPVPAASAPVVDTTATTASVTPDAPAAPVKVAPEAPKKTVDLDL